MNSPEYIQALKAYLRSIKEPFWPMQNEYQRAAILPDLVQDIDQFEYNLSQLVFELECRINHVEGVQS